MKNNNTKIQSKSTPKNQTKTTVGKQSKTIKKTQTKTNTINQNKKISKKNIGIDPILHNVAGIDIGSALIHVAILDKNNEYEVREFGAMTTDLEKITKWLVSSGIKTAAMEATGIYGFPLLEILNDNGIKAVLVDPKKSKNVPGRKTDVLDCQWIHRLFSCGLLESAFRPAKDKEAFRAYMRHRGNLIKGRQRTILQMNKALLLMNLKLDLVVSEVTSVTGMNIIRAIVGGERNPERLAALRHPSCKKPVESFVHALSGNFQETHLFALKQSLESMDHFAKQIDECDKMIFSELQTWETIVEGPTPPKKKDKSHTKRVKIRKPDQNEFNFDIETLLYQKVGVDLTAISSLGALTVATVISELGGKEGLDSFKTEKHWTSWLGLCPGNNVSGGKSFGGQSRKCVNRIKQALCMAAVSLCNSTCSLGAYYRRMASRVSKSKAIKAVAHKLARLIYNLVKNGHAYIEMGQEEYEKKHEKRRLKNLMKNAKELGYELILKTAA